jgi:hypothetical protein
MEALFNEHHEIIYNVSVIRSNPVILHPKQLIFNWSKNSPHYGIYPEPIHSSQRISASNVKSTQQLISPPWISKESHPISHTLFH